MGTPAKNAGQNTSDYSATKAPENQPHMESAVREDDSRMQPGGSHGSPVSVGMESLHAETVPAMQPDQE